MRRLLLAAAVVAASVSFGSAAQAWPCGNPKLDVVCGAPDRACRTAAALLGGLNCEVS
jgi:hypothetical protein